MDNRSLPPEARGTASSPNSANSKLLTIFGSDARIEGKFQIAESIEVQCEVTGELSVGGTLVIGDRGRVSADVTTVNAVIIGTYTGNLKASGSVEIATSGRVSGSVQSNELVIAKGAIFTGTVAHVEREAQPARQKQTVQQTQAAQPTQTVQQPKAQSDVETPIPVARLVELDRESEFRADASQAPQVPLHTNSIS